MKITLKVLAELCLYMSVISTFPTLFATDVRFWLVILCCCVSVFGMELLCGFGYRRWRFIAVIPALLQLLAVTQLFDGIVVIPAVVYTVAVIIRGETNVEYSVYKSLFVKLAIAWFVYAAFMLLGAYMSAQKESVSGETAAIEAGGLMVYGCTFLLMGTALLRKLRINTPMSPVSQIKANAKYVVGVLASVSVIALLNDAVLAIVKLISGAVFETSAYVMMLPAKALDALVHAVENQERRGEMPERVEDFDAGLAPSGGWGEMVQEMVSEQTVEKKYPWLLMIGIVVVLCIVLILVLRKSSKLAIPADTSEDTPIELTFEKKKTDKRSPRERIRKIYRGHIKSLENYGIKIAYNDMSEDILRKTERGNENRAARRLREIYMSARYDLESPVPETAVSEAEKTVREII